MADYRSLTVDLPEPHAELLQSLLHDLGALGLEVRDSEAPPLPGVRAPAPGEAIVVAYFDGSADVRDAAERVRSDFPDARVSLEDVPAEDWSVSWRARIRPVEVGRLWVGPPWELERAPADKARVVIEPKMAFGTGDHPTTALCLAAVDEYLREHPGASVLDVGMGTGVLAIAARKLGAARVVGVDNDPVSVDLARENALVNGVVDLELSGTPVQQVSGTFDLVLANILANTLVELAPAIAARVGTRLVLAGVLAHQKEEVEAAYRARGLVPLGARAQGDWVRIDVGRP